MSLHTRSAMLTNYSSSWFGEWLSRARHPYALYLLIFGSCAVVEWRSHLKSKREHSEWKERQSPNADADPTQGLTYHRNSDKHAESRLGPAEFRLSPACKTGNGALRFIHNRQTLHPQGSIYGCP